MMVATTAKEDEEAALATISNETRTAITSPTSIVSLLPTSLACLSTTLKLLVQVIHLLG
jgi:hypothetical protein